MDRGVDDLEVGVTLDHIRVERQCLDGFEKSLVHGVADDLDFGWIALEFDVLDVFDAVDVVDNINVVGRDDLCTVAPISLIAVVDLGIV